MTINEKRDKVRSYCHFGQCKTCILRDRFWEHSIRGSRCLSIARADENELTRALELIENEVCETLDEKIEEYDPVNKPAHYTDGKIEVIDFIEDKNLGFCLGNAIKYIARAGKKNPDKTVEDLNKAIWYINRRIKELEEVK